VDIVPASIADIELMYEKAISKMNNNSSTTESSIPGSPLGRQFKRKSHDFLTKFPWLQSISYSSKFIAVSLAKAVGLHSDQKAAYNAFSFLFGRLDCFFKHNKHQNVSLSLAEYIIKTENNEEEMLFIQNILVR
jgi:hypothetical protein